MQAVQSRHIGACFTSYQHSLENINYSNLYLTYIPKNLYILIDMAWWCMVILVYASMISTTWCGLCAFVLWFLVRILVYSYWRKWYYFSCTYCMCWWHQKKVYLYTFIFLCYEQIVECNKWCSCVVHVLVFESFLFCFKRIAYTSLRALKDILNSWKTKLTSIY
jgi:hypothetical protein